MAWIPSHTSLRSHPKTKRAARLAGVSLPQIIGHLHLLWWWALEYAPDGNLSIYDADDIEDAMEWDGEPGALIFALVNCGPGDRPGFLIQSDTGLIINDWNEYGGRYLKKKEQTRQRINRMRERNRNADRNTEEADGNADVTRYTGATPAFRNGIRVEESRGEKSRDHHHQPDRVNHQTPEPQTPDADGGGGDKQAQSVIIPPEIDEQLSPPIESPPSPDLQRLVAEYERLFAMPAAPIIAQGIRHALQRDGPDRILLAMHETATRRNNGHAITAPWNYTRKILDRWHAQGVDPTANQQESSHGTHSSHTGFGINRTIQWRGDDPAYRAQSQLEITPDGRIKPVRKLR